MSVHTEGICVRCNAGFTDDDAQVTVTIESSDLGCFRNVEKAHFLCGQCYSDYRGFVYETV
jgi:hypothetical protein